MFITIKRTGRGERPTRTDHFPPPREFPSCPPPDQANILIAAVPAALAGAADWSEQHEQQMRVGIVHAAGNAVALSLYGASLVSRDPRLSRALRVTGLAAVCLSGLLGGHISFRLIGGANHAEEVPHLVKPGWQHLMAAADLPQG